MRMDDDTDARPDRRGWIIGGLAAVIVILLGALAFVAMDDDDDDVDTTGTTTTTTTSATTTSESTTSTSTPPSTSPDLPTEQELDTVVWPGPATGIRYTEALAAVEGFATDLLGFVNPIIGDYMAGDSRSGEVEIRADVQGPPTTAIVRQLSDDTWWILGAATESIELSDPEPGEAVRSPVALAGRSRAFEAVVNVSIFDHGATTPLGEGVVMGSGDADLGPFTGELEFDDPAGDRGVLVLYTLSARDGEVWEAIATPVRFG